MSLFSDSFNSYDDFDHDIEMGNDVNSCYCTNHSICTICVRGYA